MRLHFHTNLDEAQSDVGELSRRNLETAHFPVPRKGDRIVFSFERDGHKKYDLDVVAVVHDYSADPPTVHIELHMPSYYASMSIADWMKWFNRHRFGREW